MRYVIRRSIRRSYAPLAVAFLALAWSSTALAGGGDHAGKRDKLGFWDSRHAPAAQQALNDRAAELSANAPAATAALKDSLGAEGLVNLDPLTRTARFVGKTDGFLTGPSPASPADIALKYIKANAIALGLSADALAALTLRLDYVDILGTHHLSFTQVVNDVTVFGNGVKVGVTKNGQIVNVTGSPVGSFSSLSGRATPGINASQAITSARKNVELEVAPAASTASGPDLDTQFANGDSAKLVYFKTLNGLVLAWQTLVTSGDMYQSIVDASSGKVLWRQSLTHAENGKVWDNRPGAAAGGTQHDVNLAQWGQFSPTTLFSNNSLAYSDINGNNSRQASESVLPGAYLFQPFTDQTNSPCSTAYPCSWNSTFPAGAFSWQTNMKQNTVQAFYYVNTFHDHLAAAPIGFTEAAGNFQLNNTSGFGLGNDPVRTEANDGANTLCCIGGQPVGLPDPSHSDNANMSTPPDGSAPRMQMYLFNDPLTELNGFDDPFLQANGGDEAAIVYHEYTHGLSNRLVVDADGNSTLGNIQAGAMGEAWSDWYALDYLNSTGNIADVTGKADVLEGDYVSAGHDLIRTEATDCKVGTSNGDPLCDGDPSGTAGTGGYTYGDFGKIIGRPEVHADGEIWGQTLWDLRDAVGSEKSDMVVTRALELSPANPSFLDMRNAILQADLVAYNGANRDTIWKVFANRGMGYFAAAVDGDDAAPVEDFQLPPRSRKSARLAGVVFDADTKKPILGASIEFGGHASGFANDIVSVTNKWGIFDIKKILVGRYPKVSASAAGYDRVTKDYVLVERPIGLLAFKLRRNYADLSGGGRISVFNGPDYTDFGCGPYGAIDGSEGNGWGSTTDDDDGNATGHVTPKFIVVKLPQPISVAEIAVNPSNTCGDPGSSSTRGYRIQVSADGTTFTNLTEGVFYAGNRNKTNTVWTGSKSSVQYVKFWMLNPQVSHVADGSCTGAADCGSNPDGEEGVALNCPGPYGGCEFMDMSELKVYGKP